MVRAFHAAGIEVILDVVFNHTAEGGEIGPTYNFRGLDNQLYYLLDEKGRYLNFTGCGNTVNSNHPVVRNLLLACLQQHGSPRGTSMGSGSTSPRSWGATGTARSWSSRP